MSPPASSIVTPRAGQATWQGILPASDDYALKFIYTNDVLANVRGGKKRGGIDQGKLEASLYADMEKAAGMKGLTFFANGFFIHNTGRMRRDYVGGINTIAAIEATPTTRLSELWLEQSFAGGRTSLRIGQLTADSEFFTSDVSDLFLQSDWATITAVNLPSGAPAYPLSTPGIRLRIDPADNASVLFAVFNGDPAGPGPGDEQERNPHGLNLRVNDPALLMLEMQLRANQGRHDTGLARSLKLGGWAHLGQFDDQRYANDGTLLADPGGSGVPAKHRGNQGIYAVIDQQIHRPPGGGASSGVAVFSRISGNPSDRNAISFFIDGGIVFAGLVPGRPHDRFGLSAIYARYSESARAHDRDQAQFSGVPAVVRDYEANLEMTYLFQLTASLTMHPVLTRVWHASGGAYPNATVAGARAVLRF